MYRLLEKGTCRYSLQGSVHAYSQQFSFVEAFASSCTSYGRPWNEVCICMHPHSSISCHSTASQQLIPLHNHLLLMRLDELSTRMTSESVEKIRVCMR